MFTVKSIHIVFEIWGSMFCLIAAACLFFTRNIEKKKRRLVLYMQLSAALLLSMDACDGPLTDIPEK